MDLGVSTIGPSSWNRGRRRSSIGTPSLLLRGLIHSDGWRGTNRVTVRGKRFEYPRYSFSDKSLDIQEIFCRAADRFGVSWRQMNDHAIAVSKRSEVAKLDEVVGPKY